MSNFAFLQREWAAVFEAAGIEETYHGLKRAAGRDAEYEPFEGIVLTDTFQLFESGAAMTSECLPENTARVKRQKAAPIRVVMSNPPYSVGQDSENDSNKNLNYPALERVMHFDSSGA